VASGWWIKGTGVDCDAHGGSVAFKTVGGEKNLTSNR
jgi:hypothetical protein